MGAPRPKELFADADGSVEIVERFEAYKSELNKAFERPLPTVGNPAQMNVSNALSKTELSKAVSAETINSLQDQLTGGFLAKDLNLAGPGTTGGLAQYDLSAPAKQLVPVNTPIRNRIPRLKGFGNAHEYKRILGYSGSNTGGVSKFHPGQAESDTVSFGSLSLHRGQIISYAGDDVIVPLKKFAVSDRVTWDSYQAGLGYQDIRQLSTTTALRSAMLLEEQMLLGSRGTASAFSGAVATPSAPTVTSPAATGSQAAVTGALANVWIKITATTMWGETALSASGTSTFTAGDVVQASWAHVPGATGYNVFVSTAASSEPADTASWYQTVTAANTIVLQGALKTSGRAASTVNATNTPTAFANGYDGILPVLASQGGYFNYQNGPVTIDAFQTAFAALWDLVQSDPETVLLNGHDRLQLSNLLTNQSSTNYMITLENRPNSATAGTIGAIASSMTNGLTGKVLELAHHPFMPQGIAPILSWTIPTPDSNIPDAWACVNTTDYMSVQWPEIEFYYDTSVYWRGTFCSYAPQWSGAVAGITSS